MSTIFELTMTYQQVAQLFERFPIASTWSDSENPRVFLFHREPGEEYTVDLSFDDGRARYLRVPFDQVSEHVEPTGETISKTRYYRLRRPIEER